MEAYTSALDINNGQGESGDATDHQNAAMTMEDKNT